MWSRAPGEGPIGAGAIGPPGCSVFRLCCEQRGEPTATRRALDLVGRLMVTVRRIARRSMPCGCPLPGRAEVVEAAGRERPPSAAPDAGPTPRARGVAHAPAAVSSRPDARAAARVVVPTPCAAQSCPPARRAPRLEMVTTVTGRFLKVGRPDLHQARHARQTVRESSNETRS